MCKTIFTLMLLVLLLSACASPATPANTPEQITPTSTNPIPTDIIQPTEAETAAVPAARFSLSSPAFKDGNEMAEKYTYKMGGQCDGENYSPALTWAGAPAETQSFAITLVDPDGGNWAHWVQFNIPADVASLPETIAGPEIGVKGRNDFYSPGYGGPCPPGGTHHYVFTLYALDTTLELEEGATLKAVLTAMEGHILAETQLTGLRTR